MLKKTTWLVAIIIAIAGCPVETADTGCTANSDCDSEEVCVAGACLNAAGEEGEGEGEGEGEVGEGEGEGEVGEGEGAVGEGEGEGEGEGDPPDLTPRVTSQQFILGAPQMSGNTFQVQGRIAVVPSTPMTGSTFRAISIH